MKQKNAREGFLSRGRYVLSFAYWLTVGLIPLRGRSGMGLVLGTMRQR